MKEYKKLLSQHLDGSINSPVNELDKDDVIIINTIKYFHEKVSNLDSSLGDLRRNMRIHSIVGSLFFAIFLALIVFPFACIDKSKNNEINIAALDKQIKLVEKTIEQNISGLNKKITEQINSLDCTLVSLKGKQYIGKIVLYKNEDIQDYSNDEDVCSLSYRYPWGNKDIGVLKRLQHEYASVTIDNFYHRSVLCRIIGLFPAGKNENDIMIQISEKTLKKMVGKKNFEFYRKQGVISGQIIIK